LPAKVKVAEVPGISNTEFSIMKGSKIPINVFRKTILKLPYSRLEAMLLQKQDVSQ